MYLISVNHKNLCYLCSFLLNTDDTDLANEHGFFERYDDS